MPFMKIKDIYQRHLLRSRDSFFSFVDKNNETYRLDNSLTQYKKIIERHRSVNNIELILDDDYIYHQIMITLEAWNMNQRGAKLTTINDFKKSVLKSKTYLTELYNYKLSSLKDNKTITDVLELVDLLFYRLSVMESGRKIVGVSKALHFLLPDLIMPIDSKYTMDFFYGYNKVSSKPSSEFNDFKNIFNHFIVIIDKLSLNETDVDGDKWNTSLPKLIDNGIIGVINELQRQANILVS